MLICNIILKQIIQVINQKIEKFIISVNIFCLFFFLKILFYEGHWSLKDADDKQSNFTAKIKNLDKGKNNWQKDFLNNLGLLFSERKNVLKNFKSRLFPIKNLDQIKKSKPTSEPATKPTLEPATKPTKTRNLN